MKFLKLILVILCFSSVKTAHSRPIETPDQIIVNHYFDFMTSLKYVHIFCPNSGYSINKQFLENYSTVEKLYRKDITTYLIELRGTISNKQVSDSIESKRKDIKAAVEKSLKDTSCNNAEVLKGQTHYDHFSKISSDELKIEMDTKINEHINRYK